MKNSTSANTNDKFNRAKKTKDDEYYTPYEIVADELDRYYSQLYGKTIYCPCDDPRWSSFVKYFVNNRDKLNATIYATCYYRNPEGTLVQVAVVAAKRGNPAGILDRSDYRRPRTETEKEIKAKMLESGVQVGRETQITILEKVEQFKRGEQGYFSEVDIFKATNKGDFEKTATFDYLLQNCDVVVTNPPFSKFREFIQILADSGKKFLIIGSNMGGNNKNVFELIRAGKVWMGFSANKGVKFIRPDGSLHGVAISWFTNLYKTPGKTFVPENGYTCAELKAAGKWAVYNERKDILYLAAVADYPVDYFGLAAVPPSAIQNFLSSGWELVLSDDFCDKKIGDKRTAARIVVRRKKNYQVAEESESIRRIEETAPAIVDKEDGRGYIYILQDESGRIKIGVTKNMIEQRVNDLQTGNAEKISVVYLSNPVYQYENIEAAAHQKFSSYHIRGEWFRGDCFAAAVAFLTHETAPSKQDVQRFRNI